MIRNKVTSDALECCNPVMRLHYVHYLHVFNLFDGITEIDIVLVLWHMCLYLNISTC